jgi:hypothetical protein
MQQQVMIDLETLGNRSNSVITSIGAVIFDQLGPVSGIDPFYATIDVQDSVDHGLQINGSTIEWWFNQDPEVALKMFHNARPLRQVLEDFRDWGTFHGGTSLIMWGNSPRFDLGLLDDAYKKIGEERWWDFRAERDLRTLLSLAPGVKATTPRVGSAHNSIDDCLTQIEQVRRAYVSLLP